MKIFAGPSLSELSKRLINELKIDLLPPIRRIDLPRLKHQNYRGTIVIVDGYFYQDMAVGHAEILEMLRLGCKIYGLSSMGAIRAFEMKKFGMQGYGEVYRWFFSEQDFQDDEVALLHDSEPHYFAISEPLVHFRECLQQLANTGVIKSKIGEEIIQELKSLFFGDRTMALFKTLLQKHSEVDAEKIIEGFEQYRIKARDLESFLIEKPWSRAESS